MIVGVGVDLMSVERFAKSIAQYGERILERVFTGGEREYCRRMRNSAEHFAARFAAKEAVSKALGTGVCRGVGWKEIEVVRERSGRPTIKLTGGGAEAAARIGADIIHISLTHSRTQAAAFAVAERLEPQP